MGNPNAQNELWVLEDSGPAFFMTLQMVVQETHVLESDVTDHAVERGANIVDHVREKPARVTMEVFITNQPIDDPRMTVTSLPLQLPEIPGPTIPSLGALNSAVDNLVSSIFSSPKSYAATIYTFAEEFDDVQIALARLESLRARGALLQLFTPKRAYENMVLEGVQMARGAADGDGATLHLSFRQIRIVESKKVRAPAASEVRASSSANKGTQSPKEKKVSVAAKIERAVGLAGGTARPLP